MKLVKAKIREDPEDDYFETLSDVTISRTIIIVGVPEPTEETEHEIQKPVFKKSN